MRLGRYETLFRLAAGGMAEVHVARLVGEGGFEKLVALKRMLPNLAADERFVGMFLDEAKVAANISSPHVVSTLDLGRADDDSLYIVMELVVGVSLAALRAALTQQNVAMPVDLGAEILAQAALGLHDAHEARTAHGEWLAIVHRDVSPQNVLVDVSGRVRITDFGVARAIERVTQTESGEVKGKLAYFAPEQARAKPLDRRADVFALGIVAWELLTGQRLFAGDGPADTVMRVLEMPIPRVDALRPDVPAALADAIARALDRDVHARTETAADFAQEIRAAVPSVGLARVGELVRERGGQTLRRLEDGIRSHTPSSSGRVSAPSRTPRTSPRVEREPDVANDTIAQSGVVSAPREPTAATVGTPPRAAESPAGTGRGRAVGAVIVTLLVAGGLGLWMTQREAVTPPPTVATHDAPPPPPSPAPPSTVAELAAPPPIDPPPTVASVDTPSSRRPRRAPPAPLPETAPTAPAPAPHAHAAIEPTPPSSPPPSTRAPERSVPSTHATHALAGMDDFESELGD